MKKIMFIFVILIFATLSVIGIKSPPELSDALDRQVNKVGVQSNGQVILAGDFSLDYLVRLNRDNSIDTTFAQNVRAGLFNKPVLDFEILKDDSIIVVGEFTSFDQSLTGYVAKLNKDGSLDTNFTANTGAGFDDSVSKVKVLQNGQFLVVGKFSTFNGDSTNKVALLNADGKLDDGFNERGSGFDGVPLDIAQSDDGEDIYISGNFNSYNSDVYPYIIKMNSRGIASESFGLVD